MNYRRTTHPEENWCVRNILEYVDLFYESSHVRPFASESTLFDELYSFIKKSKIINRTVTELTAGSKACNESKNLSRDIGSVNKVIRQQPGEIPDLAFIYSDHEIACVEIGLEDKGTNGTKEMNEKKIKTPKMMRNFAWRIKNNYNADVSNIKIISFVISGPYLNASMMTFEHGSVGLISSSDRVKMPTTIKKVPRLLPAAMRVVYNSSLAVKETVEYLDDACGSEGGVDSSYFPPSFEPAESTNKKRKSSVNPSSSSY